jgi:hypothetical protein
VLRCLVAGCLVPEFVGPASWAYLRAASYTGPGKDKKKSLVGPAMGRRGGIRYEAHLRLPDLIDSSPRPSRVVAARELN